MNRHMYARDQQKLYLAHHGILGQKWGVRRFQNPDGTLTPEGRERYGYGPVSWKEATKIAIDTSTKYDWLGRPKSNSTFEEKKKNDRSGKLKKMELLVTDVEDTYENLAKTSDELTKKDLNKHFDKSKTKKDFEKYMDEVMGGSYNEETMSFEQVWDAVQSYIDYETRHNVKFSENTERAAKEANEFKDEKRKIYEDYINELLSGNENLSARAIDGYSKSFKQVINDAMITARNNDLLKRNMESVTADIEEEYYKLYTEKNK